MVHQARLFVHDRVHKTDRQHGRNLHMRGGKLNQKRTAAVADNDHASQIVTAIRYTPTVAFYRYDNPYPVNMGTDLDGLILINQIRYVKLRFEEG
jgi:hypothetical protein